MALAQATPVSHKRRRKPRASIYINEVVAQRGKGSQARPVRARPGQAAEATENNKSFFLARLGHNEISLVQSVHKVKYQGAPQDIQAGFQGAGNDPKARLRQEPTDIDHPLSDGLPHGVQ